MNHIFTDNYMMEILPIHVVIFCRWIIQLLLLLVVPLCLSRSPQCPVGICLNAKFHSNDRALEVIKLNYIPRETLMCRTLYLLFALLMVE